MTFLLNLSNWTGTNSIHPCLSINNPHWQQWFLQNASPGLDEVDDARTVDRDVLFCYHLDDFLRYDTTKQCRRVW